MITSVKEILTKARKEGYAVGAFNVANLETTRAVVDAAKEMHSPVIIQMTEKTLEYAGGRGIFHLVKNDAEFYAPEIPVGIHLDHGKSFEIIQHCVDIGFTSVMYDNSRAKYKDNLENTKRVVEFCHNRNTDVQAELGSVPNMGEMAEENVDWDKYMTDPEQAVEFVKTTGIDTLAVAIGNAHGFMKEKPEPDYERLKKINKLCNIPLILHGASDWENEKVAKAREGGINCFNIDTASRMAFVNDLTKSIKEGTVTYDIRKLLGSARDAVKKEVERKITYFGSGGKA